MTIFQELLDAMKNCKQGTRSVLDHGMCVHSHLETLIELMPLEFYPEWKIPDFIHKYRLELLENLHSKEVRTNYAIYHDCGKSFCKTFDEKGVHFPNHAAISKQKYFEASGDQVVSKLIGFDMDIHTLSSIEIEERCKIWTVQDACTLLLTALAEIHSNAKLFGGIQSTSFKAKHKTIERRGNQICKHFFGEKR